MFLHDCFGAFDLGSGRSDDRDHRDQRRTTTQHTRIAAHASATRPEKNPTRPVPLGLGPNFIETGRSESFKLMFRLYGVGPEVMAKQWQLDDVDLVDAGRLGQETHRND